MTSEDDTKRMLAFVTRSYLERIMSEENFYYADHVTLFTQGYSAENVVVHVDEAHTVGVAELEMLRDVMDRSVSERIIETSTSDDNLVLLDETDGDDVTDDDVENSRYKIFMGDSTYHFAIDYELDRFKDRLYTFIPIISTSSLGVAPIVQAWSLFHDQPLMRLSDTSAISTFINDLDTNRVMVTVYVFGNLSDTERYWLNSQYETKRIEWVTVSDTGVKTRKTR